MPPTPADARTHGRRILVASNRGPVSFVRDDSGEVAAKRGTGGLVSALTGALQLSGGLWLASAMTDEDREQAASGALEEAAGEALPRLRYLSFDPDTYDRFYNGISNRLLWFAHHMLWDIPHTPRFDRSTRADWDAYVRVNRAFAEALAEEGSSDEDSAYLIQDYHLALVPSMLRELRPGARIAHFSHIPFADAGYLRILPGPIREALVEGLLGADLLGFQSHAWASSFVRSCQAHSDGSASAGMDTIEWRGRTIRIGVYPISIDVEGLRKESVTGDVTRAQRSLARWLGDRKLLLRVDRAELSKNILRGFASYELFLSEQPQWHDRVVFLAHLNPTRTDLPEYRSYLKDIRAAARRINGRFGRDGWMPVRLSIRDDFSVTLAAYSMYDVLLVNPVFDGMNLVAKEGPVVNERDGVLILSENTGAFEELGAHAVVIDPFDIGQTAEAIAAALEMDKGERARRAAPLREAVEANPLDTWVQAQVNDLDRLSSR